ncbi:hexokinase-1 [Aureobasidium pullulans]|uniref:Phosphotransferase n=1 Tax=Aureobasidium pullulans TaxID=5580 RepID=A0A4S8XYB2_AURPU|nr:hexokinase-1 [Aureobasidium pullulans]THW22280.1 hexokinase-1 [Aureobasidium pullulans]THW43856.1 hexokinase-1 [Aureobasidium pullulans]THW98490.1 hexokinase-1 [Aureobasidium pullulans]THX20340.1 hexokinase-1 [Aureobasidium pullulans]
MDKLLHDVEGLFEAPLRPRSLHAMSEQLQAEFRTKLQSSNICMLPSFHHTLPTGSECGDFVALDVGGSTFRIALVHLTGKNSTRDGMEIKRMKSFVIDKPIRDLKGKSFFEWMAARIEEVIGSAQSDAAPLSMAMSWSFPIEQTSTRSGSLLTMGKGFCATHGVEGQDIYELLMDACRQRNLQVQLQAIINDSSATLLSQAYRDPSTRLSLILGTGMNSAIYLPVSALAQEKYGSRPESWHACAKDVLVNTELSMFGKDVLPASRWDHYLNATHAMPDFQPLEHRVSGRYLGELVRLVLIEAIETADLFSGMMPAKLQEPYSLDTGTIAVFESDSSSTLSVAACAFASAHPLPAGRTPSSKDLHFIRQVSRLVSGRAAALVATAVHALWSLQHSLVTSPSVTNSQLADPTQVRATVACNGTVMEKYPGFRSRCQGYLDELAMISGQSRGAISIEMALESSVFGAAVAAASESEA